jgi:hypothetical protein
LPSQPHIAQATIVLPGLSGSAIQDVTIRKWLSKGQLSREAELQELIHRVLADIGHSAEGDGLAALRFWGQTGERSGAWMAGADPVYLEARLNHVRLHALGGAELPQADVRRVFDYLQDSFGSEEFAFARLGMFAYLRGAADMATAGMSSYQVHGLPLDDVMPQGPGAETHDRLLSEIQMSLHEHKLNVSRGERGMRDINSLWFWGGGTAPELSSHLIGPLFSDDPLFHGFWLSRGGMAGPFSPGYEAQARVATDGFVSVVPEFDKSGNPVDPVACLARLRTLLNNGSRRRLVIHFRDGLRAELMSVDRFRFWRRESPLLSVS